MEIPKELEGYPAEQLRIQIGSDIYRGLSGIPPELEQEVMDVAIKQLKTHDPLQASEYSIGTERSKVWYEPVIRTSYYGGRDLAHPSGVGMKRLRVWP